MSYDTLYFAVFLAVVWVAFRIFPWGGWILLIASIVFYSVAGLRDSILAATLILLNYGFQFLIVRNSRWLWAILAINFGCLAYFKYRVFLATTAGVNFYTGDIVIPLGISFYVFQLSAFMVDIKRKTAQPFYSLARFSLFKLFFGQLVAGPIMRWRQFGWQINHVFEGTLRQHRLLGLGLGLCLLGLTKKIVFADSFAPIVDDIFRAGPASASVAWLGAWLFGFQIYFDFSGYSDIALGIAYLFGMRLAVNFRQPYLSRTPQEFWQRWHITLSQWIRDYLYIPLGGNRGSRLRVIAVLVVVMALAGLWHGSNWTFAIWGMGWAVMILLWRLAGTHLANVSILPWLITLTATFLLWVFFRAADISSALAYIGTMFGARPTGGAALPADGFGGLLIALGCAGLIALHWIEAQLFSSRVVRLFRRFDGAFLRGVLIGLSLWLLLLPKASDAPFIYFRF